ncbi:hypothetical protein AB0J90_18280 [Micromonospora sp. NPDC049523]|uniref:plasmid mobilization protein n=1 Tax=Micromonospora sp. NPDC049523 TaxID=3155921 RepID=UPI0034263DA4
MNEVTPDRPGRVARPRAGRDRPHLFPGRPRAVNARFTDDEYSELTTAADLAGLTPTGFCAQAALDAARSVHMNATERAEQQALARLQAEMFRTRVTVNQMRSELGRILDAASDERRTPTDLDAAIARAADSLAGLDAAISLIHGRFTG